MKLVTIEYVERNKEPHIMLFIREDRKRKMIDAPYFKPYLYIPTEGHSNYKTLDGTPVTKLETVLPQEVGDIRDNYEKTWESDVHFTTRYLIDEVPKIEKTELRIQYTDIEKDMETDQIIAISAYDNYLNKCVCFAWRDGVTEAKVDKEFVFPKSGYKFPATIHIYRTRNDMLKDYVRFVRDTDPDILTGWFFVQYDAKELIQELKNSGLGAASLSPLDSAYVIGDQVNRRTESNIKVKGRVLWDMLKAYSALQPTRLLDSSLEAISQEELGEGKEKLEKSISWNWKNDFDKFVEYNAKDAVLVYRLDQKKHLLEYYDSTRRWIGCEWDQLFSETLLWDTYILRKVHGKVVLPRKKRIDVEKYKGALVFTPLSKGIHRWIIALDFKSLYPSIIMTFNMSPETVYRESNENLIDSDISKKLYKLENGVTFLAEPRGIFPTILEEMVAERKKYQVEMNKYAYDTEEWKTYFNLQTAVKVMMNALYGASAYENFRLATPEIASSITFMGRKIIDSCKREIEKEFKVLYGDTDSLCLWSHKDDLEDILVEAQELVDKINLFATNLLKEYGVERSFVKIELKKVYETFIMADLKNAPGTAAKKRYAGRVRWADGSTDKLEVVGFEAKRSDSSIFSRRLQKEVLRLLLYGEESKIKPYIQEAIRNISKLDLEEVGIPRGLSGKLDDYETDNPWLRGSVYSNTYLNTSFGQGDKPKVVYVRSCGKYPRTDVVAFTRTLPKDFVVDYDIMIEKDIVSKIEHILDAAGMNLDDILTNQESLDKF